MAKNASEMTSNTKNFSQQTDNCNVRYPEKDENHNISRQPNNYNDRGCEYAAGNNDMTNQPYTGDSDNNYYTAGSYYNSDQQKGNDYDTCKSN